MNRLGLLALLLSACTGTVYPYGSSQPQYASSTVAQTTESTDGTTTTTTTSTETATFEAYPTAQPAAYEEAPPPPPADEPPPPPPPSGDPRCDRRDTPEMCVALNVMLDVGAIIKAHEDAPCREAARALNRYADSHPRELDTFATLDDKVSRKQLEKFQRRHEGEASLVIGAALELDTRCEGDQKLDRALHRVGFSGLIGSPVL